MDNPDGAVQKIEQLQREGKFDEAARVYFADLTCDWDDFPADARALDVLRPFFANGIDQPPVIEDGFNQSRLAVDLAHAFFHRGQLTDFERSYGVAFERYMSLNIGGNLQGHLAVFGDLLKRSNQLARAERTYQYSLRLAGDDGLAAGNCHLRFMALYVETGQLDKAADTVTRYELAMPDTRDRVYEDAQMASLRIQMKIVHQGQPLSDDEWKKVLPLLQRYTPAYQRTAYWMGELALRNDDLSEAAGYFNTAINLAEQRYANPDLTALAQGGLARLAALDENLDKALEMAQISGDDYAIAEVYRLALDRENAVQYAKNAYKWAWADGSPYTHFYQLERVSNLLDELGELYPPMQPFQVAAARGSAAALMEFSKSSG
ncbi:MAG: hypothetical protein L0154_14965 [Chloroflexi bacterium]|nr:hypothetical protein [Chloroflexota bacterium]